MNYIVRISLSEVYFWFLSLLKILKKTTATNYKAEQRTIYYYQIKLKLKNRRAHTHTQKFLDTHIKQKRSSTQ